MVTTKWHQTAALGSGVVIACSILLYYFVKESKKKQKDDESCVACEQKKLTVETATRQEVETILRSICASQKRMKELLRELSKQLVDKEYTFDEVYKKAQKSQPDDPLEKTGLTMVDFDNLIEKFDTDEGIRSILDSIMLCPPSAEYVNCAEFIDVPKLKDIHRHMLSTLSNLLQELQSSPASTKYESKSSSIAVQAILSAEVERKFRVNNDQLEAALYIHHQELAGDAEFAEVNSQLQASMTEIVAHYSDSA